MRRFAGANIRLIFNFNSFSDDYLLNNKFLRISYAYFYAVF